ncbi:MAG: AMP-binding protein [Candidatus Polarisedimenticolaceae bacterium]|nr:AMP-binding protein [Candidatus Polarisedimenticolaceae bacterium]
MNTFPPKRLLHDCLIASKKKTPESIAAVVQGREYTYQQLHDEAVVLAEKLVERGVQQGDRLVIYMDNTWPCVVSIYATLFAGGVFIVVNPQTKADKLEYILNDCAAALLLTDNHLANVFLPVLPKVGTLLSVICSNSNPKKIIEGVDGIESFEDIVAKYPKNSPLPPLIATNLAALIYTSGSTGNPKGVMQTHQSMLFTAGSLTEYLRLSESHRILCVLPLAFDYGLYQLLMSVFSGATLVLETSFTYTAVIFNRMREQATTVFPGVPTIFSMLIAAHKRKSLCFPDIIRVTNTAAALPKEYIENLREIFPNALIYKMYGLTECKRVCYLEPELLDEKPTSVGKAIPGTELFLLSLDGESVATNEVGVLHVKGPHIMQGYWNDEERSNKMLRQGVYPADRTLCTHDFFRMDEEGFLYFIGRDDDIIKCRGEKVSPVEIENALHGIDGVKEAAVIGLPDPLLGEAIYAYVALENNSSISQKQLKKICTERLENNMIPKEFILIDELPKTITGKISKKLLLRQKAAK